MALYLGTLIFSFIISCLIIVPYIDFLYSHPRPALTPAGGGVLVIITVCVLYWLLFPLFRYFGVYISSLFSLTQEQNILFFTFISFGVLGVIYDYFRLSLKYLWAIVTGLSLIISTWIVSFLHIQFLNFPSLTVINLGVFYIPVAALTILIFSASTWVSDQIDGLSNGLLLICLLVFWAISLSSLDTPLSIFVALWIGSLIALLYFNVFPARITTGSAGKLSFGATLAVVGLILGKPVALFMIGGLLIANLISVVLQAFWLKVLDKKLFIQAPIHNLLLDLGWGNSKIMMRGWLAGVILALFGLWLALL